MKTSLYKIEHRGSASALIHRPTTGPHGDLLGYPLEDPAGVAKSVWLFFWAWSASLSHAWAISTKASLDWGSPIAPANLVQSTAAARYRRSLLTPSSPHTPR